MNRPDETMRRAQGRWSVTVWIGAGLVAWGSGVAAGQVEIPRQLSVQRTPGGFVLYGFTEAELAARFAVQPGQSLAAARRQMYGVAWDRMVDAFDRPEGQFAAVRTRYNGEVEAVRLILDRSGERVARVVYRVWPVPFTRRGILEFFRRAYRSGEVLVDTESEVVGRFRSAGVSDRLVVRALRLSQAPPRWSMEYVLAASALEPALPPPVGGPGGEAEVPAAGGPRELIQIWPPPPDGGVPGWVELPVGPEGQGVEPGRLPEGWVDLPVGAPTSQPGPEPGPAGPASQPAP